MAGHPFSLEHAAGGRTCAVGTLMAVELGAVLHGPPVLSQSLDGALETFSLGSRRCVDLVALSEDICLNLRSQAVFFSVLELELPDILLGAHACLLEMPLLRLVGAVPVDNLFPAACVLVDDSLLLVHKAHLDCAVTVVLHGSHLRHHAGACLEHGHGDQYAVLAEDLSHSDFCRQNCFLHFSSLSAPEGIVYIADHAAIVALQPPRRRDCVLTSK